MMQKKKNKKSSKQICRILAARKRSIKEERNGFCAHPPQAPQAKHSRLKRLARPENTKFSFDRPPKAYSSGLPRLSLKDLPTNGAFLPLKGTQPAAARSGHQFDFSK